MMNAGYQIFLRAFLSVRQLIAGRHVSVRTDTTAASIYTDCAAELEGRSMTSQSKPSHECDYNGCSENPTETEAQKI